MVSRADCQISFPWQAFCHCLVAFNAVCIVLFVTAVMIYPIKLETSLSSFQIPDHPVYLREDAFETATGTALSAQNTQFARTRILIVEAITRITSYLNLMSATGRNIRLILSTGP